MSNNELKVLIIEDLKIAQLAAAHIFSKLNFKVHIANNGASALELIILNKYDLILLDIQLPDMSGFEITKTIRSLEKNKHIPIIAITANSYENLELQCRTAGFDDYLIKPLSIEATRYIIGKHLSKSKQ